MNCVDFVLSGGCEDRDILWAFFTNLSIESIYLSPELRKNGLIFKTTDQKKINTVHNLITFLLFSQIKLVWTDSVHPHQN